MLLANTNQTEFLTTFFEWTEASRGGSKPSVWQEAKERGCQNTLKTK